jgi:hypothetical protein
MSSNPEDITLVSFPLDWGRNHFPLVAVGPEGNIKYTGAGLGRNTEIHDRIGYIVGYRTDAEAVIDDDTKLTLVWHSDGQPVYATHAVFELTE